MTGPHAPSHPEESRRPIRRNVDLGELLEIERAASGVVEPVSRLWLELTASADRVVTPRSLDAALRGALETMGRLLSANSLAILLANEAGNELTMRAAIGLSEELSVGLGIHAGEGMAGRVLKTREPLVVGDLSAIHVVNPVLRHSGLRSVAAVPLLSDDHPLGVVWAGSYERDRFTAADAELLQVVADRLGAALDRVRLFERERSARREAERLAERIARIQRATAELAATYSSGDVAEAMVRVLESDLPVWRAVWLLRDEQLELTASSSDPPPGWDRIVALGDDAPQAHVFRTGHASYGVTTEPGSTEQSWAALPVITRGGPVGALAMVADGGDWFTPDERLLLALIVGQASQAFERAQLVAAERQAGERASFFASAAQVLAEADDLAETLDRLAGLAVSTIGEICLIDVIGEDGRIARMAAKHRDPGLQPLVERLRTEFPPDPEGKHPAVRAITSGESTWAEHISDEFLRETTVSDGHLALVRELGFHSYLTVPLVASGSVVGSVTCVSTSTRFSRDDMTFAEELARHVAAVVDTARSYESAFHTSQILQSSLLPGRLPEVAGVRVETRYLTANRGLEVGGDFYDVLSLPTGHVMFTVGDVAGHDRGAAAQMGHLRSAARALAGQASTPSSLISALRAAWPFLGFERIATAFVGLLDPSSGELSVASAGHYPPLVVAASGATFLPLVPSPPLGMEAPLAAEWHGKLGAGQVLIGYTDGAIDERVAGAEESMANLIRAAESGDVTPVAVCDRLVAAISSERADDVALLAVAIEPS